MSPRVLAALGGALAVGVAIAVVITHGHKQAAPTPPTTTTVTTAPAPTTTAPPPPPTTTQPAPTPPPAAVPMSWDNAGAIVWHSSDVDPTWLGQTLRAAGFGWVAVYLGENGRLKPPDSSRGLPVRKG